MLFLVKRVATHNVVVDHAALHLGRGVRMGEAGCWAPGGEATTKLERSLTRWKAQRVDFRISSLKVTGF